MYNYSLEKPIDNFTIAMAYVPWQNFNKICENLEDLDFEGKAAIYILKLNAGE